MQNAQLTHMSGALIYNAKNIYIILALLFNLYNYQLLKQFVDSVTDGQSQAYRTLAVASLRGLMNIETERFFWVSVCKVIY